MKRTLVSALALCLLLACSLVSAPSTPWLPGNAVYHEIMPTAWHEEIWNETVACVRLTHPLVGDKYKNMRWYTVEADNFWNPGWALVGEKGPYVAVYVKPNRILIIAKYANDRSIVSHEAIHAITQIFNHPADLFTRCTSW